MDISLFAFIALFKDKPSIVQHVGACALIGFTY